MAATETLVDVRFVPDPTYTIQRLDEFADELKDKGLQSGLTKAAGILKKEILSRTPIRRGEIGSRGGKRKPGGTLRKSIGSATLRPNAKARLGIPQGTRAVVVGPIRKVSDPNYSRQPGARIAQGYKMYFLEYGTKRHTIPRESQIGVKPVAIGGKVFESVNHPGIKPLRIMEKSHSAASSRIKGAFFQGLSKRLDRLEKTAPGGTARRGIDRHTI